MLANILQQEDTHSFNKIVVCHPSNCMWLCLDNRMRRNTNLVVVCYMWSPWTHGATHQKKNTNQCCGLNVILDLEITWTPPHPERKHQCRTWRHLAGCKPWKPAFACNLEHVAITISEYWTKDWMVHLQLPPIWLETSKMALCLEWLNTNSMGSCDGADAISATQAQHWVAQLQKYVSICMITFAMGQSVNIKHNSNHGYSTVTMLQMLQNILKHVLAKWHVQFPVSSTSTCETCNNDCQQ